LANADIAMPSYKASTRAEELRSYFTLIEQLGAPIEQLDDPVWHSAASPQNGGVSL